MLAAIGTAGDPLLNLWILGWDLAAIHHHPGWLLDGRIFNANIFHPAERTLAYSDHLIPQALAMWPVYAVTRDPVLCYNVLFFGSLVASGVAMDAFVRRVTGSPEGALFAGLAWTVAPFRFAHYIHLQLQGLYVLPLTFLALHRFMARRATRDGVALGLALALQAWTSVYYGVIGGVGTAAGALALMSAIGRGRDARTLRRLALAAIVAIVLVMPIARMYSRVQQEQGFGRSLFEASNSAARAGSYLRAPAVNLVYGDHGLVRLTRPNAQPDPASPERQLFPGLLVIGLAVAGALSVRGTDRRPLAAAMLAVAATGFILSLGPDGVRPLYAFLHRFVFGFQAIRASARFAVLVSFALVVLAALGLDSAIRRLRTGTIRRAITAIVLALALLEWTNRGDAYMAAPPRTTAVGQWLKNASEPGAVVYLPLTVDVQNTPLMVQSLEHLRPIVNGYSGQVPSFYSAIMDALAAFPAGDALWTLRDLDVRFVVAPASGRASSPANDAGSPSPLVERARLDGSIIYELQWTPEIEAALPPPSMAPPPPPGPMPFADAEQATYAIFWTGGVARAEAGRAVVTARRSEGQYELTVEASTAAWVGRFFEARDRFETTTTRELLPLVHRRHVREGRRAFDRTYAFDLRKHLVTVDGLSLPLVPGSRDPLSAFFYVRTLPWSDLPSVRVPVNDAGKNVVLAVARMGEEAIEHAGARSRAIRLECTVEQRIQRRRPVTFTVWLSRDARRLPLVISLDAGFGRVRAELVSP